MIGRCLRTYPQPQILPFVVRCTALSFIAGKPAPTGIFVRALAGGGFRLALPGDVEQFVAVLKGARFAMATYGIDFVGVDGCL